MALSAESLTTCILLRAFFEKLQLESFSHCKACTSKKLVLFRFLSESETNLAQIGFLVFVHFLSYGVTTLPDLWRARLDFGLRRNISFLHWSFSLTVNCFEIKSPKCHFLLRYNRWASRRFRAVVIKPSKNGARFDLPFPLLSWWKKPRSLTVASKGSGLWQYWPFYYGFLQFLNFCAINQILRVNLAETCHTLLEWLVIHYA